LSRRTAAALLATATLTAVGLGGVMLTAQASTGPARHPTKRLCGAVPTTHHRYACLAEVQTDTVRGFTAAAVTPPGYGPVDLQSAYRLPSSSAGAGQTVAIVDAFDDPKAESDLAIYRSQFGLPACTTANGCFRKVNQNGAASPLPRADPGWAGEISLDLDMVSAVCPKCKILLVEANSANNALYTAIDTAARLGAKFISASWGGNEGPGDDADNQKHLNKPGVVITASSGDGAYGVLQPASSRFVTAVGGTTLNRANNSRGWSETVWSGAGSGCSIGIPKPSWQRDTGCARRTVADVSAVADPQTGVSVYDTYNSGGWLVFGGTSASAPIVASVYALAGTPAAGTNPASYPYGHTGSLFDVTSGSNGSCSPKYLCTGSAGYDGPSGLGTPNGVAAFTNGGSPPPPPPTGNLALHKKATSSKACNKSEGAAKAVNGSVSGGKNDKWCSHASRRWLRVDLGAPMTVGRFVVRHAAAGGEPAAYNTRAYTIQVSTDGKTWKTVVTVKGNTDAVTTNTIAVTTARYIRLNVTTPAQNRSSAARIYELEVYAQ
jgi:hypothetical protein